VTLRFRIKTLPMKQWEVGRELRRRIKKAFDARGIRIPGPQMHITMKQ
jgi:small conductance mechanosensitive channel